MDFHADVNLHKLKQRPHTFTLRDRQAIDSICDPPMEQGCIEKVPLTEPSQVACAAFIVWNKNKPRMVIDLWPFNEPLILNAYPLPRQDDIFNEMGALSPFHPRT